MAKGNEKLSPISSLGINIEDNDLKEKLDLYFQLFLLGLIEKGIDLTDDDRSKLQSKIVEVWAQLNLDEEQKTEFLESIFAIVNGALGAMRFHAIKEPSPVPQGEGELMNRETQTPVIDHLLSLIELAILFLDKRPCNFKETPDADPTR